MLWKKILFVLMLMMILGIGSISLREKNSNYKAQEAELQEQIAEEIARAEEIAELDKTANAYKKYHADVIENGTLYHISSPFESRYLCMQSVSADQTKSAFLFMTKAKILQENRFFKLKGLQNEAKYKCSYDDLIYTGEYLMKIGLNLSELFVDAYTTELIFLERVKEM